MPTAWEMLLAYSRMMNTATETSEKIQTKTGELIEQAKFSVPATSCGCGPPDKRQLAMHEDMLDWSRTALDSHDARPTPDRRSVGRSVGRRSVGRSVGRGPHGAPDL